MNVCENCGKEHDGSYGSGRFCSKKCRMQWIGKKSYETSIKNGTYCSNFKNYSKKLRKPYGTWKCSICGEIFETRSSLTRHKHDTHKLCCGHVWNKGLTKETDPRVANHSKALLEGYANGTIKNGRLGCKHTEEEKNHLSEVMKRKILTGEIEAPYKRNHYSKGPSYPETYFINIFNNAGLHVEYNFQVGLYQLDFANPLTKKYVEIDGEQHYVDSRIVKHDVKRTKELEQLGWILISRVRWSKFQKLSTSEREIICKELIEQLS